MPKVECKNMRFERALRIFRKKCDNANIVKEVRERQYYEKPTAKRKRKNVLTLENSESANDEYVQTRNDKWNRLA